MNNRINLTTKWEVAVRNLLAKCESARDDLRSATVVHTAWNRGPNRCEWLRVASCRVRAVRIIGGWWILYGPLVPMWQE